MGGLGRLYRFFAKQKQLELFNTQFVVMTLKLAIIPNFSQIGNVKWPRFFQKVRKLKATALKYVTYWYLTLPFRDCQRPWSFDFHFGAVSCCKPRHLVSLKLFQAVPRSKVSHCSFPNPGRLCLEAQMVFHSSCT